MFGNICSKRYEPAFIDLNNDNCSYSRIIKLAGENKKILEIGPSTGYITKILKERGNIVTGIEMDPEAAGVASQYCDRMITGDIETLDLEAYLNDSKFDAIIFGDVLEHLRNPGAALVKVQKYLGPGGYLVVSIPNVCHGDLLLNMLYGDFKYTTMGLLDETHLRFFALRNIVELFNRSGYCLAEVHTVVYPVGQTELRVDLGILPPGLLDFIRSLPNSSVYQFVFKAIPGDPGEGSNIPYTPLAQIFKTSVEAPMVRDKEDLARSLTSEIRQRELILCERDRTISELSQKLEEYNARISSLDDQAKQLTMAISDRNATITSLDGQLSDLTIHANVLKNELDGIKRSIVLQALRKFDEVLLDNFLPYGTWGRHAYGDLIEGARGIVSQGLGSFLHSRVIMKGRKNESGALIHSPWEPISHAAANTGKLKTIERDVAVIIPTRNAGPDFKLALEKIRAQQGIRNIEVIVVDSGSTDGTVELAKRYGANAFGIRPEEFNHGTTRNYGAEQARGDYILFMVQDAVPADDHWLHDMVAVLESDEAVAAVTCRQVPRPDADLFACFSLDNHYKALELTGDKVASFGGNVKGLSPREKRKLALLNDTCCLIRKSVFDRFRYKDIPYAEDVELGLRLVVNGYKVVFLSTVSVIHSHNRDPSYTLRRGYVDHKFLTKVLSFEPAPDRRGRSIREVFGNVLALYASVNAAACELKPASFGGGPDSILEAFKRGVQYNLRRSPEELKQFGRGDASLDKIFNRIKNVTGEVDPRPDDALFRSFFNILDEFRGYLKDCGTLKDKDADFADSMYKLFALSAASMLSGYYLRNPFGDEAGEAITAIDRILSEGV